MTEPKRDNVLIVHWHDLGRYLGAYGHADVSQPAAGPAGRRGHPVHPRPRHRAAVLAVARVAVHRPLPAEQRAGRPGPPRLGVPGRAFGHCPAYCPNPVGTQRYSACSMRHRIRRGSGSTSTTCRNSYCEYVVEHATRWLADPPAEPFLLTAGFFETHRPYPHDRYEPADARRRDRARLPARHRRRARRISPTSTDRSPSPTPRSGSCWTPWPRRDSTRPPGWCS